jgi:hypothetical protein
MAFSKVTGAGVATDTLKAEDIAADAIGTAELANDVSISTSGNIATTGSGTLAVAGASTHTGAVTNSSTLQQTGQVTMGSGGTNWTLPTARGTDNYVLTTTSGTGSWIEIALAPDITAVNWYSDSGYSESLTTAEAINKDDTTYLKVTGINLATAVSFGSTAYVQIINASDSNAIVGHNQNSLNGCITAASRTSDTEIKFTINPTSVSGIVAGNTLQVKIINAGGEELFGTGYVVSADPTSVTTVNSATISNTASVGSYGGQVAGGSDDANTHLYLKFDRYGGTDIEDSSNTGGTGHKVIVNGDAKIKSSPFGDGKSAMYFDGVNDVISMGSASSLPTGAAVRTVEFWANVPSSFSSSTGYFFTYGDATTNEAFGMYLGTYITFHGESNDTNSSQLAAGIYDKWVHIAQVYTASGKVVMYVDGKVVLNVAKSLATGTGSCKIGDRFNGPAYPINGYIDEFRISSVDRYSAFGTTVEQVAFTPPTARFSDSDSDTDLLIHSDKEDDASSFNHRITYDAGAYPQPYDHSNGNFAESALVFSGNSTKINIPGDWDLPGDFCIEFRIRRTAVGYTAYIGTNEFSGNYWWFYDYNNDSSRYLSWLTDAGAGHAYNHGSNLIPINNWVHIALTRSGSTMRLFKDGTQAHSWTSNHSYKGSSLQIGKYGTSTSDNLDSAALQEIRIVKGEAVFTGNFTPSTYPYGHASATHEASTASNVKLLIHGDGAIFSDSATSGTTHDITPTGSYHTYSHGGIAPAMAFATSGKKTPSAGCYFDGTGDYLQIPDSADWDFGTGAFTIDLWFYPTATTSNQNLIHTVTGTASDVQFNVIYYPGGVNNVIMNSGTAAKNAGGTGLTQNVWSHIAVVRDGSNNLDIYINGTKSGSTYTGSWNITSSSAIQIGNGASNGGSMTTGYMDSIRVSKGVARWTSNFTPPTQAYGAFQSTAIDTVTLTGTAGSGGGYVTFTNATLSGNTESAASPTLSSLGLTLNEDYTNNSAGQNNTATITGTLTASAGTYSIPIVARATSDGTDANIDPNRKQDYSHTIIKNAGAAPVLFNARRYVGDGDPAYISGFGFKPDLIWTKKRNASEAHGINDSIRGAGLRLFPDTDQVEASSGGITSFDSDGFTTSDGYGTDAENDKTYIAWGWKAGGVPTGNYQRIIDGDASNQISLTTSSSQAKGANVYGKVSGTNQFSDIRQSVNSAGGFSITKYTSTNTSGNDHHLCHGLGATPAFIIIKARTATASDMSPYSWIVWHKDLSTTTNKRIMLDLSDDEAGTDAWGSQSPDSTSVNFGSSQFTFYNNATYIMYAWKAVAGVSSFGTYEGDGGSNRTITTGFKPRWLMVKSLDADTRYWVIHDSFRDGDATTTNLYGDLANAEDAGASYEINFNSTGFAFTTATTYHSINNNSETFIYAAFA